MQPIFDTLRSLVDVDMASVPPTDGQAVVWDETAQRFVPGVSAGGAGLYHVIAGTTTAEVQAELDAVADGTTVFFPARTYDCTAGSVEVHDRAGLTLLGAGYGAVLQGAVAAPVLSIERSTDITVRNIRLQGDNVAGAITKTGIAIEDAALDVTIDGCWVHDMGYDGIYCLLDGVVSRRLRIVHNTVWNCKDDGINPGGGTSILTDAVDEVIIAGNTVRGVVGAGIHVSVDARYVIVAGNTVEGCGRGIDVARSRYVEVSNNILRDNTRGFTTEAPSGAPVIRDVSLVANTIVAGAYAIDMIHATENLLVADNLIRGATTLAVQLANLTDGTVRGNQIIDGTIVQGAGCVRLVVEANRVAAAMTLSGDTINRLNIVSATAHTFDLGDLDNVDAAGSAGTVLTLQGDGTFALETPSTSPSDLHRLVVLVDDGAGGLEPLTDSDGYWLYGAYPGPEL